MVLISDGLANQGDTTREGLLRRAGESAGLTAPLTAIGVGVDFDENLMGALADSGGGNFYFLRDAVALAQVFEGVGRHPRDGGRRGRDRDQPARRGRADRRRGLSGRAARQRLRLPAGQPLRRPGKADLADRQGGRRRPRQMRARRGGGALPGRRPRRHAGGPRRRRRSKRWPTRPPSSPASTASGGAVRWSRRITASCSKGSPSTSRPATAKPPNRRSPPTKAR